jgi:hypothetical protein
MRADRAWLLGRICCGSTDDRASPDGLHSFPSPSQSIKEVRCVRSCSRTSSSSQRVLRRSLKPASRFLPYVDGNIGCGFLTIICGPVYGPAGVTLSCTYAAPAGLNWIFAAPSDFTGVPCGSPYLLTVDCGGIDATESKTWGQIKGMFR